MCPSPAADPSEQPLIAVKDYRPSTHGSSSSDGPDSTDEDCYQFEEQPSKPCPFAQTPRVSKYGKTYRTRHAAGSWEEKPVITTIETPVQLRCWSINGPDETGDHEDNREIVYMDEHITVHMKDMELINLQWELDNLRPGPPARIGKLSPLQKSHISRAHPLVLPRPKYHASAVGFGVPKSCFDAVADMLTAEGRLVEEPSSLSDSSSDSADQFDFNCSSDTDSSPHFKFGLHSSTELHSMSKQSSDQLSEQSSSDERLAAALLSNTLTENDRQHEATVDVTLQSDSSESRLAQSQALLQFLALRVEKLVHVTASLQERVAVSFNERQQLQEQLLALKASCRSAGHPTSPRNADANGFANADQQACSKPRSPRKKRKSTTREEDRLRKELMAEKQRTAQVQLENDRLLGVIFKLKKEMELEHDLMMRIEKKLAQDQACRRAQRHRSVAKPRNLSRDPKKKVEQRRRWIFSRSKSSTSKKCEPHM